MPDRHSLRHDLDGATPEQQAIHLALQREVEVDLSSYATQKWVREQGYLTSVPENPGSPGEPIDINLDGYATIEYSDAGDKAVEDASIIRDEAIQQKFDDESTLNTAAHLRLDGDIVRLDGEIDALSKTIDTKLPLSGGTVNGVLSVKHGATGGGHVFSCYAAGLGENQVAFRVTGDGSVKAGQDNNHPFLAVAKNDVVTKAYLDQLEPYDDNMIKEDIKQLQEGFDEAVLAAQDGADNLTIELQSYSKKDHTHNYAAKDHNHSGTYVKGDFQITKSNGCFYIQ